MRRGPISAPPSIRHFSTKRDTRTLLTAHTKAPRHAPASVLGSSFGGFWTCLRPASFVVLRCYYGEIVSGGSWTTLLNDLGTQHMAQVRSAFNSRQWYNFKPDFAQTTGAGFAVGGSPTSWNTMTSPSYIARARSADKKLAMAYLPYSCSTTTSSCTTQLTVKVDMVKLATPASDRMARWYNPTNGSYQNICGTRLGMAGCGTGSVTFTTPGGHSNEAGALRPTTGSS